MEKRPPPKKKSYENQVVCHKAYDNAMNRYVYIIIHVYMHVLYVLDHT